MKKRTSTSAIQKFHNLSILPYYIFYVQPGNPVTSHETYLRALLHFHPYDRFHYSSRRTEGVCRNYEKNHEIFLLFYVTYQRNKEICFEMEATIEIFSDKLVRLFFVRVLYKEEIGLVRTKEGLFDD